MVSEKRKEYSKKYYLKNKEKILERQKKFRMDNPEIMRERDRKRSKIKSKQQQERMIEMKKRVFKEYGGKCMCCGEETFEFLSVDHTNGDGYSHRKELGGTSIYRWLIKNNFPKDRFQILCFNCNLAKGFYGGCPHRRKK